MSLRRLLQGSTAGLLAALLCLGAVTPANAAIGDTVKKERKAYNLLLTELNGIIHSKNPDDRIGLTKIMITSTIGDAARWGNGRSGKDYDSSAKQNPTAAGALEGIVSNIGAVDNDTARCYANALIKNVLTKKAQLNRTENMYDLVSAIYGTVGLKNQAKKLPKYIKAASDDKALRKLAIEQTKGWAKSRAKAFIKQLTKEKVLDTTDFYYVMIMNSRQSVEQGSFDSATQNLFYNVLMNCTNGPIAASDLQQPPPWPAGKSAPSWPTLQPVTHEETYQEHYPAAKLLTQGFNYGYTDSGCQATDDTTGRVICIGSLLDPNDTGRNPDYPAATVQGQVFWSNLPSLMFDRAVGGAVNVQLTLGYSQATGRNVWTENSGNAHPYTEIPAAPYGGSVTLGQIPLTWQTGYTGVVDTYHGGSITITDVTVTYAYKVAGKASTK